jgi:Zn-dependent peptidase ImmA (M78 family)
LVSGFEHFDASTFIADGIPVVVTKTELPGDRQRFNLGHELGYLILDVDKELDPEAICHRFVGAFLVPALAVRFELGSRRTTLDMNELPCSSTSTALSMQAWIFRAKDLGSSQRTRPRLFNVFEQMAGAAEPGEALTPMKDLRMERLIYLWRRI